MSVPSSSAGKAGSPKKPVSPVRNIIGLVVLIAVCVAGWFQYTALAGYNAAVTALETRSQEEGKDLMSESEAAKLLNKEPDDPGSDFKDGNYNFTKKTYTWRGLKSYTVTAYYTKSKEPALHHFETSEKKYEAEPVPAANTAKNGAAEQGKVAKQDPAAGLVKPEPKIEGTKPEATKPEATKPEATKPEATKPEATKPEATKPEATKPEATKPDAKGSTAPAKAS